MKNLSFLIIGFVIGALCVSYEINKQDYLIDLKQDYLIVYDVSKSNADTLQYHEDLQEYFINSNE